MLLGSTILRTSMAVLVGGLCIQQAQAANLQVNHREVLEDGSHFRIEVQLPPVHLGQEIINGQDWQTFQVEDAGYLGVPGAPDLPAVHQLLAMPDRADVEVRVLGGEYVDQQLSTPLPQQERMHTEYDLPLAWLQSADIYHTDAFWPQELFTISDPALLRNHRVSNLGLHPVQVNPVSGVARIWTSMELSIRYTGENPVNQREFELVNDDGPLNQLIASKILNPAAEHHGALSSETYHNPGSTPGKYVVFGPSTYMSNPGFLQWKQWKQEKGHVIETVTSSDISWTASGIRNRVIDEYASDDPVDFVLLLGDVAQTPTQGSDYNGDLDQYYSAIDGGDILGDVAVGRIPADNANQMTAIMLKILSYEKSPLITGTDWLDHVGFTVGSSHCYLSMKTLSRSIMGEMVERRNISFPDSCYCCNGSQVVGWFDEGICFYNYRGWIGMDGFTTSMASNLDQGPRYPVVTIFTCGTGDFVGGDDYSELFVTAEGGASACIGFATAGTHTRYNNIVCGGFYNAMLEYDVPWAGSCLIQGEYELWFNLPPGDSHASDFAYWANLMGDPGMPMWCGIPGELSAPLENFANLPVGSNHIEFTVTDGTNPVEGVTVCFYQEDEDVQVSAISDANGQVLLVLPELSAGDATLTMYHHLFLSQQQSVSVEAAANNLQLTEIDTPAEGLLPIGASQDLSFELTNMGSAALTNLSISASLDADFGDLSGGPLTLSTLAAGAAYTFDGLSVNPLTTLADGDLVPVFLSVSADEQNFELLLPLQITASQPSPLDVSYPEGAFEPGSSGTFRISVENTGSMNEALVYELVSMLDYATVTSDPVTVNDFAPGAEMDLDFEVTIDGTVINGLQVPMRLVWYTPSENTRGMTSVYLQVGTATAGDPTGPDEYGYWIYEDADDTYDLAPEYEWVEIVPQFGGSGARLAINDGGEEQDDAIWMDLPFEFSYYGRSYEEVFVCSNGFIAFEENGFGEVDFRNHGFPLGIGPDAMIAPMWDDHESGTSSSGTVGVFYYYDEELHRAIFTWNDCPANQSGGPNTFQLILLDPMYYPTATGDGEFLFQYEDFNNTQSSGADFPGCSVGFKDWSSTMGLTLLNYGVRPTTMHSLGDGVAVRVTTTMSGSLLPPELELGMDELVLNLGEEEVRVDSLELHNAGELPLFWEAWLSEPAGRDMGGPDDFGYTWMDNNEDEGPQFNWLDYEDQGTAVSFAHHDSSTAEIALAMPLHLYGRRFDSFRISPNGYVAFQDAAAYPNNVELPSEEAPEYIVAGWWDNLKPEPDTEGYCWWWSDGVDSLVVTWENVPHYNPFSNGGPFTFQVIVRSLGEITIQVLNTDSDVYDAGESGTIGIQGMTHEGMTLIHNTDISMMEPWCARLSPPAWIRLADPVEGMVVAGESSYLRILTTSLPGYQLPDGDYAMQLNILCNDPAAQERVIPVSMNVTDLAESDLRPESNRLVGAWPNPFNPSTRIAFELAEAGPVNLRVFNLRGQLVLDLLNERQLPVGQHELQWNASAMASGLYILQLETGGRFDQMKLVLMK